MEVLRAASLFRGGLELLRPLKIQLQQDINRRLKYAQPNFSLFWWSRKWLMYRRLRVGGAQGSPASARVNVHACIWAR